MALGVLVLAASQATLQQLAWRGAGIRAGVLTKIEADTDRAQSLCHDTFALYKPGELAGKMLWLEDTPFPIVDNGQTWMLVTGTDDNVRQAGGDTLRYQTGYTARDGIVGAALSVPSLPFTPADILLGLCLAGLLIVQLMRRDFSRWVAAAMERVGAAWSGRLVADRWRTSARSERPPGRAWQGRKRVASVMRKSWSPHTLSFV